MTEQVSGMCHSSPKMQLNPTWGVCYCKCALSAYIWSYELAVLVLMLPFTPLG